MAVQSEARSGSLLETRRADEREMRLMLILGFVVFLFAAIISRVLPRQWRLIPQSSGARRSVFREAWVAANATIPVAFMH